ncbi:glycosyltransferase [Flammeovirga sp. SJP92]|uniref:glycosyltransferase n=1 Tax=Flammeovirga sp. SJP92 TaxID=1775430 RepID=UPI0007875C90|nr:glycosyltransferase [Flammeovirga sp. SJP92]KXX72552.1 hypothetical protein AVL50_00335 [Flammeovirga sp. SJP92]
MKILNVIASLDKSAGGPSRSVPTTCNGISHLGTHITLLSNKSDNPVKISKNKNFEVIFLGYTQLIIFCLFKLKNNKFDLIHLQHIWHPYTAIVTFFSKLYNIPYLITPRGMLEPWIMNKNPIKKKIALFLYQKNDLKRANCIHATCELEKNNIQKVISHDSIKIVPNGLDLSKVPSEKQSYNNKKVVFLSRIHQKKGIELLIEAWKKIDTDWKLEIAGDGEANYIKSITEKINNSNSNIEYVGAVYGTEKWDFIKSSDIFILPTYSENFGIVVAEALSVGVPVITTKGTPWNDLNVNKCGWWIDLSIDNLADTLQQAINTSPDELREMGKNGIKLITSNYDIKQISKRINTLYFQIQNEN